MPPAPKALPTSDNIKAITPATIAIGRLPKIKKENTPQQSLDNTSTKLQGVEQELQQAEEKAQLDEMRGDVAASWGDQMRNYVLNPYQVVKDLRTGYEVGNPSSVFDGDIDGFLEAGIRWRRGADQADQN